jgi:hypothetical protein
VLADRARQVVLRDTTLDQMLMKRDTLMPPGRMFSI